MAAGVMQLVLLGGMLIPVILFFIMQQDLLLSIRRENRQLAPGKVWLQLIPVFGAIYQFGVIDKVSKSIENELNAPIGDSIFSETGTGISHKPTYNIGMAYAILIIVSFIPLVYVKSFIGLAALICWVIYWVQLAKYRRLIKQRLLLA